LGWCGDRRSAELLGDQSLQFAAGEKAGKWLPSLASASEGLVTLTRVHHRNRGGCLCIVQKEILYRPLPASSIVVDLTIALPQGRAPIQPMYKRLVPKPATASTSALALK
jgi:hypothetical protein